MEKRVAKQMSEMHAGLAEKAIREHAAGMYANRSENWHRLRVEFHSKKAEEYRAQASAPSCCRCGAGEDLVRDVASDLIYCRVCARVLCEVAHGQTPIIHCSGSMAR